MVGLFVYNYNSPTFVLKEEKTSLKDSFSSNFIESNYSSLTSKELKVLSSKMKDNDVLKRLYATFNKDSDLIGLGIVQTLFAKQTKSDSLFTIAGNNLLSNPEAIKTKSDADYIFGKAKENFQTAIDINKNNLAANNGLALCYIDYDQQVMKGVGLLKQTLSQDSNNIEAIQYLGFLSIKSNQLEKAIERFKKLVDLQPLNSEHYNNLSEVYLRMGDKQKAIYYLNIGKKLSENK